MIIGLSGKKQTGKDTLADYLIKTYNFTRVSFADKVKDLAKELFGWDGKKDEKGRKLLQNFAMHMRAFDPDVWVNYAFKKAEDRIVITDVRFKNEVEKIKDEGGKVWRIKRKTGLEDSHVSETELDDYTFETVVDNNGTIEELCEKAKMEVEKLLCRKQF